MYKMPITLYLLDKNTKYNKNSSQYIKDSLKLIIWYVALETC